MSATSLLDLHRRADVCRRAARDDQISPERWGVGLNYLADRPDGVDDGSARWVCHEAGEWFQGACARRVGGECEHIWLLGLEPGDGGLQHLGQALVKERDAGRWRTADRP